MPFCFLSLAVLLGLAITSLALAAHMLAGATTAEARLSYTIWTLLSGSFVYAVICSGIIAYWRKMVLEREANATDALEHREIIHMHMQEPIIRTAPPSRAVSVVVNSLDLHRTRQRLRRSPYPHPGPLSSNPVIGPAYGSSSVIPSYRSMHSTSGSALSMIPTYQEASPTSDHPAHPPPFQFPARNRSVTDPGMAAAQTAATRIRADSLMQIRAGTARRMTLPMPATSVAVQCKLAQDNNR